MRYIFLLETAVGGQPHILVGRNFYKLRNYWLVCTKFKNSSIIKRLTLQIAPATILMFKM